MQTLRFGFSDISFELETPWTELFQFFQSYTSRFTTSGQLTYLYKALLHPYPTLKRIDKSTTSDESQIQSEEYQRDIDLFPMLEDAILKDVLRVVSAKYPVYHAAVTAQNGVATVFLGESNAGKSSLCVERIQNGHLYLSDEMAVVDGNDVIAVPRPIGFNTLENPSHVMPKRDDRFDEFGYDFVDPKAQMRHARFYLPKPECSAAAGERFPIKDVYYLEPVEDDAPDHILLDGPMKRARMALSRFPV